jgi:hypothetical protein
MNSEPCYGCNGTIPCGPTHCVPYQNALCNSVKTFNPYQLPNYTLYNVPSSTESYTIPTTACNTFYMYIFSPPSSFLVLLYLPQISVLDSCKKRNLVLTNNGSSSVDIFAGGSDTFNGATGQYILDPNSSIQIISDTISNWIVIGN